MDPKRFKEAYNRLKLLDERSYRLRPRSGSGPMLRGSVEQLEERLRELASYTVDLREIVEELFVAIASEPAPAPPPAAAASTKPS
jgi:hypothetical protein